MRMFGDKEIDFIEDFRMLKSEEIFVVGNEDEIEKIIKIINNSSNWIDSSGKDQPPPDFYNEKEKVMMEVMRVDDHGYRKHGKTVNPTYRRENEIRKELEEKGFDKLFPNAQLIVTANSGLPTKEDHNYEYYYKNFERTIKHHCERIRNYKKNHEDYKLIFFVHDESTAYIEAESSNEIGAYGRLHLHYFDKKFVECFLNEDIDYFIWMTPYKGYQYAPDEIQPPKATVYDIKNINYELIEYDEKRMISSEK
jgi:hypothetical protein